MPYTWIRNHTDVYTLRMFKEPVFGINCFKSIKQTRVKWTWCKSALDKIQLYPSFVLEFKYYQEISFQLTKFWYPIQLTWDSGLRSCLFVPSIHVGFVYGPFLNIEVSSDIHEALSDSEYPFSHNHGSVENHPDNERTRSYWRDPFSTEPDFKTPSIFAPLLVYHFTIFCHWKVTFCPKKESIVFQTIMWISG